jgi:hypothetical protein
LLESQRLAIKSKDMTTEDIYKVNAITENCMERKKMANNA